MGDSSASFNQLGGDSLAAIQFAREVDELCGTHPPVSFVLDHSHSMQDIVDKVGFLRHASMQAYINMRRIQGCIITTEMLGTFECMRSLAEEGTLWHLAVTTVCSTM